MGLGFCLPLASKLGLSNGAKQGQKGLIFHDDSTKDDQR